MKSIEQIPNQGKYNVSKSITHELNQANKPPVKKGITGHSASPYVKSSAAVPHHVKTERKKWTVSSPRNAQLHKSPGVNARKSEIIATENRPNDWFMSARQFNVKSAETAKDILRLASSIPVSASVASTNTTPSLSSQRSYNSMIEIVPNSHLNHSNSVKTSVANHQSIIASNGQHQITITESPMHSWLPAAGVQQLQQPPLKASPCYMNRSLAKTNNSKVDETNPVKRVTNQQKCIANQAIAAGNTQMPNKQIESGKMKKKPPTERKYKQKDAKSIQEKRKNGGMGKQSPMHVTGDGSSSIGNTKKSNTNQIVHHESLQRLPLHANEVAPIIATATASNTNGKRIGDHKEWHSPESYMFDEITAGGDTISDCSEQMSCMQTFWFRDLPNENLLTREQRLENKRDNLRRQAFQYAQAQHFRSTMLAKRRLITVTKALAKFKSGRNKVTPTKCSILSCTHTALAMTAYCYLHITLNKDQKLFHPCTAKFSDNSQCRVPVFDISHELPLCREHAWKRDNYNRISQEQKPKKTIKSKTETVRQPKRNKKKKKHSNQCAASDTHISLKQQPIPQHSQHQPLLKMSNHVNVASIPAATAMMPTAMSAMTKRAHTPTINVVWNQDLFRKKSENVTPPPSLPPSSLSSSQIISAKSPALVNHKYLPDNVMVYQLNADTFPQTMSKIKIQNIVAMGENSSAYESSEDTGVGELSESELITAQDGIEIPLGDDVHHDLTNVLNQLPVDAFNDLFQVQQHDHYEPTQKEQDELARALEEVDEQVKSLEQMTNSSNFLDNFLDVNDELVDGSDIICDELTTSSVKNDIRGLVHT